MQDVGYYNGKLSDGRAYRLECWRMDDMLMLTVMFSDRCLKATDVRICAFAGAGRYRMLYRH